MEGYKKMRGMMGNVYFVKRTKEEMEARRIIGVLIGAVAGPVVFVLGMALAAGVIK